MGRPCFCKYLVDESIVVLLAGFGALQELMVIFSQRSRIFFHSPGARTTTSNPRVGTITRMIMHTLATLLTLLGANALPIILRGPHESNGLNSSAPSTWRKANEYSSSDCSGSMSWEHHSPSLSQVYMDDTSHSVYLAWSNGKGWKAFSDHNREGDTTWCEGVDMGYVPRNIGCINLDSWVDRQAVKGEEEMLRRVKCLWYDTE